MARRSPTLRDIDHLESTRAPGCMRTPAEEVREAEAEARELARGLAVATGGRACAPEPPARAWVR